MTPQSYQYLCDLIYRHSHIHLGPNKLNLLSGRLNKHRRELGLVSWQDYVAWIEQHKAQEIDHLIDLVSTNHTHFFREGIHFEILASELIPQLQANSPTARQGLRCWSAACSSGEEPFTLAIVLHEYAEKKSPGMRWHIQASDISSRALKKAELGMYEMERLGLPDTQYLSKYFQKGTGPYAGMCKVKTELRDKVTFSRMNLFEDRLLTATPQHVVFCRNVLIYFKADSQSQLVHQLHDAIEPGGYLIVGHSDSLLSMKHPFKSLGNGVYQRLH